MANTGQFDVRCGGKLCVDLHRPGVIGMFRPAVPAECLHFSVSCIQIETSGEFKVGQHLVIDLQVNDLRAEELPGIVRSASASDGKHYYDIDFQLEGRRRANTIHCLRHMDTQFRAQVAEAG